MTEFRLEVKGVNRVNNKLRRLASFHPDITNPIGKAWAQNKAKQLRNKKYPRRRRNQKYLRTFRLKRSWRAMNPRPGTWSIVNLANQGEGAYAHWVVGDSKGQGQAKIHAGRWWIARDFIEESAPTLTQSLSKALKKEVNK